jgi:hypothetical protein
MDGWLDLAKLVASDGGKAKGPYEDLAYNIGGFFCFLRGTVVVECVCVWVGGCRCVSGALRV